MTAPDLTLLTAGQTTELLSRLLGAAVLELGGELAVTEADLRALDGRELLHGMAGDSYVIRLSDKQAAS